MAVMRSARDYMPDGSLEDQEILYYRVDGILFVDCSALYSRYNSGKVS